MGVVMRLCSHGHDFARSCQCSSRLSRPCQHSRMPRETELLEAVDTYFRALHACDVTLLDTVFHPASSLFDVDEGAVVVDPYPAWREVVANRPSPASVGQARREEILLVDWLSDTAAVVRVRLQVLNSVFVDH